MKRFDKLDPAIIAMQYWEQYSETLIKFDRVKAVLKNLKRELKGYEKSIKEIEDRKDRQSKH